MTKPRKWVSVLFAFIVFSSFVYFILNAYQKVADNQKYQKTKQQQLLKIEQLKQEEQRLKEEKARLENPDYILRYARGKYLLSKDGEQILRLPAKEK